jgi:Uma2 family endonuclease
MTELYINRSVKIFADINAKEFFEFTKDKDYKKERYELINGRIYLMASPSTSHQAVAGEIYRKLGNYLEGKKCRPFMALDVVLFEKDKTRKEDKSQNVFQPDVFVICDPKKIGEQRIYGAPDFAVEVVSPANSAHDYINKLSVYMNHGVKEYWIVNPLKKNILVYIKEKIEPDIYTFDDKIKIGIFDDFYIDFKELNI